MPNAGVESVKIGRSGLTSSIIGLGGGSSGRFGLVYGTRADANRLIRTALDLGITFYDGAGLGGGVDEVLAEGLGAERGRVLLSTKVHLGPDPIFSGPLANKVSSWAARRSGFVCSAATLRRRVDKTLRALRTDWIDILHLHAVTPAQYPRAVERLLPELHRMKEAGKIRAIGITEGFLSDPRHRMLEVAARDAHFDAVMTGLNFANPSAAEWVIPSAARQNLGVIGMFALRGVRNHAIDAKLTELMMAAGVATVSELAYRWAHQQPGVHVVLTGTGNAAHLHENVASVLAPPLPTDVCTRLKELFPTGQAGGPAMRK